MASAPSTVLRGLSTMRLTHLPKYHSFPPSSKIQIAAYGGLTRYHKMLTTISVKLTISGVVTLCGSDDDCACTQFIRRAISKKNKSKGKAFLLPTSWTWSTTKSSQVKSTTTIIAVISVNPLHADVAFKYLVKMKVPMSSTSAAAVVTSPTGGCLVQRQRSLLLHACWP